MAYRAKSARFAGYSKAVFNAGPEAHPSRAKARHASVAVVNTGEMMCPASLGKLGEPISEVAKPGADCYGEHAECRHCDACACIDAVQQEHKPSDGYSWDCK
jgi:hypothetical protein